MTQEEIDYIDRLIRLRVIQIFYEIPKTLSEINNLYDTHDIQNIIDEIKDKLLSK